MRAHGVVRVQVLDAASGTPLTHVGYSWAANPSSGSGQADDERDGGRFEIGELLPGRVRLTVYARDYVAQQIELHLRKRQMTIQREVRLQPGNALKVLRSPQPAALTMPVYGSATSSRTTRASASIGSGISSMPSATLSRSTL